MSLADADARRRIREDLDATLLVEAAAGTGKTSELIRRIVAVLRSGRATLDRIAAVTFTEKAAGEMKLRLRAELEQARKQAHDQDERAHLTAAMSALELAHIHTIHGFCAELLRERPIEAGVDPTFEVLDDAADDALLRQAFDGWFERVLDDPPEGVRRVLRRAAALRLAPREQLLRACRELCEHRDFTAAWSRPDYDRHAEMDAIASALRALGELARHALDPRDHLCRALLTFRDFAADLDERERTRGRDYDGLEAQLLALAKDRAWNARGNGRMFGHGLPREDVFARRAAARALLSGLLERAEADVAARLQQELAEVVAAREALKSAAGALDFQDLLLYTRSLLRDHAGVRAELRRRFTHLFVDEFQDTDPLQAEIVRQLAAADVADAFALAPGKLFLVGDPKQSIYRFRRADVMFYEREKQRLLRAGAELVHLHTSFRSRPEIVEAANSAFAPLMTGAEDGSQARYVALSAQRAGDRAQPALLALPVPSFQRSDRGYSARAVEASYPEAVASFVDWLVRDSGFCVEDGGVRVPVAARHVCLLLRRFQTAWQDVTRSYVRALEARRIPHVLVGGRSLHGREEVVALRAALCAIEWPDDELHVYATLRGPFFALCDEALLCARQAFTHLHPLSAREEGAAAEHAEVDAALALLARLHRGRNQRPIAETIARLLAATRAHAGIAIWPTGEQALANLFTLADAARSFDMRAARSFRGFVEWLEQQSSAGRGSEALIVEEGSEGVRLMTVHKAKGLEFPVVVLCDPTAPIEPSSASRYVDPQHGLWAHRVCGCRPLELQAHETDVLRHDRAENVRLAYVAVTRARDLLVVPVLDGEPGKSPSMGWVDTLAPALHVLRAARGTAAVWREPADARPEQPIAGVRQLELLRESARSPQWIDAHARWLDARERTVARAAEPTSRARPVTALAVATAEQARAAAAPSAVTVLHSGVPRTGRPHGARFGTLVHAVLAQVPLGASATEVSELTGTLGRLVAANAAEVGAAVQAVCAALAHDLLVRAASSSDCRREVPVVQRLADGTLAEGIIDLAFLVQEGWVVIDFKTDLGSEPKPEYVEQVCLYVEAVRAATGAPARGVLLGV